MEGDLAGDEQRRKMMKELFRSETGEWPVRILRTWHESPGVTECEVLLANGHTSRGQLESQRYVDADGGKWLPARLFVEFQ